MASKDDSDNDYVYKESEDDDDDNDGDDNKDDNNSDNEYDDLNDGNVDDNWKKRPANNKASSGQKRQRAAGRKNQHKPKDPNEMVWNDPDPMQYGGDEDEPVVDFQMLSGRAWARESILNYLPIREVDSLVGWATHITHDGGETTNTTSDNDEPSSSETNDNGGVVNNPTSASNKNPLLGIQPDSPLPLSMLHHLIRCKARDKFRKDTDLMGRFDTSALVAMGMILEEMMTANLLPLAERHVQRCRQMEIKEQEEERQQRPAEQKSFEEWTLPPEEAIHNLMTSHPVNSPGYGLLPTTLPPTRSLVSTGNDTKQTKVCNKAQAQQRLLLNNSAESQSVLRWCKAQQLKISHVQKNMDIYQWFIPVTPPVEDEMDGIPLRKSGSTGVSTGNPLFSTLIENASAEAILKEHKMVTSSNSEHSDRVCSHAACTETAQFMCDNTECRAAKTQTDDQVLQGLFFCDKHIDNHHQEVLLAEHKLVANEDREVKGRPRRRKCFHAGCKKMTHFVCNSHICRAHAFSSKAGETVYGLFLCKEHIESHHHEIQQHITKKSSNNNNINNNDIDININDTDLITNSII